MAFFEKFAWKPPKNLPDFVVLEADKGDGEHNQSQQDAAKEAPTVELK